MSFISFPQIVWASLDHLPLKSYVTLLHWLLKYTLPKIVRLARPKTSNKFILHYPILGKLIVNFEQKQLKGLFFRRKQTIIISIHFILQRRGWTVAPWTVNNEVMCGYLAVLTCTELSCNRAHSYSLGHLKQALIKYCGGPMDQLLDRTELSWLTQTVQCALTKNTHKPLRYNNLLSL